MDAWHIKPDLIVKMPKPYMLKAHGPDEFVDVTIDPGFTEDLYVTAIETLPIKMSAYKVIHHATANVIEDEDDPTGFFVNEYAIGKAADVFPPESGRLIKAGSKFNFNLHMTPNGEETAVGVQIGFTVLPKGQTPKYVAFTQHMGDVNDLDIPAGATVRNDGYFRLPRPALISAFQPHMHMRGKAQCMEAIYPDIRADSAAPGPGAHRDAQLREQLQLRLERHLSLRRRRRAAAAGGHDHPHHLVARQLGGQQAQSESGYVAGLRADVDRRDELRLGRPDVSRAGRLRRKVAERQAQKATDHAATATAVGTRRLRSVSMPMDVGGG